jgi:hypothetical protein
MMRNMGREEEVKILYAIIQKCTNIEERFPKFKEAHIIGKTYPSSTTNTPETYMAGVI